MEEEMSLINRSINDTIRIGIAITKPIFELPDLSSVLSYGFQFGVLLFLVYCLKYKLTINSPTASYEFTSVPKTIAKTTTV